MIEWLGFGFLVIGLLFVLYMLISFNNEEPPK